MNITRNLSRSFSCLVAVLVGALALPNAAISGPTKQYGINLTTVWTSYDLNSKQLVPPAVMAVTVTNLSPPTANSNISSFSFTVSGLVMVSGPGGNGAPIPLSPYCPGAQCSIDSTGSVLTVTNIVNPVKSGGSSFTVQFQVSSCGVANVVTSRAYTGSQLTGQTFTPTTANGAAGPAAIACGTLACNDSFTVPVLTSSVSCSTNPNDPSCVVIKRGVNKDGVCSATDPNDLVTYTVTNLLATNVANKLLHVEWATDPTAAFAYRVNAATNGQPKVSWLSQSGNPVYIDAPTCNVLAINPPSDLPLPRRYGALAANIGPSDTTITVNLDQNNVGPAVGESIIIETERLLVVDKKNPFVWTVARAQGGTSADPAGYLATQPVMFTPLPLVPVSPQCYDQTGASVSCGGAYSNQIQAQMCRASSINGTGPYNYWIIDIGDGYTKPAI